MVFRCCAASPIRARAPTRPICERRPGHAASAGHRAEFLGFENFRGDSKHRRRRAGLRFRPGRAAVACCESWLALASSPTIL